MNPIVISPITCEDVSNVDNAHQAPLKALGYVCTDTSIDWHVLQL